MQTSKPACLNTPVNVTGYADKLSLPLKIMTKNKYNFLITQYNFLHNAYV